MALYTLGLLGVVLWNGRHRLCAVEGAVRATGRSGSPRSLFGLALLWHAWIGMRDIWMDYIKPAGLRLTLEVATVIVLVAYAAWLVEVLWGPGR